jgi:hypothetical protein
MHTGLRRDVQVGAVEEMRLVERVEELEEMILAEDAHLEAAEGEVVVEEEEEAVAVAAAVVGVEEVVEVKECVEGVMDY